jgi:hypothetical protein
MTAKMIEAMVKAEIRPELIYAYAKTGLIVSEMNKDQFSEDELAEYEASIEEYFRERARESGRGDPAWLAAYRKQKT